MILTTHAGELGTQLGMYGHDGLMFGETAVQMPELRYWQRLEHSKDRKEQMTAKRVATLGIWRMFRWEPEAAEKVLGWIRTGEWSPEVAGDGKRTSGLLGPDGRPL